MTHCIARRFAACLVGVTGTAFAQGVVPPLQVGQSSALPGLNAFGPVLDVDLVHQPGDPPNVFYCALTLRISASNYDLLCGSYDVLSDTFTPNNDAAALNTSAQEIGLRFHHSGLLAIFDRAQWAWLASRPAVGQPWQIVGQVAWPTPPGAGLQASLADYRGQSNVVYTFVNGIGTQIWIQPIDLTTAVMFGQRTEIVRASINGYCFNPTPVTDPSGELLGVSHGDVWMMPPPNHLDHHMSLDLDVSTPSVLMYATTSTNWSPGGFVGGRFFDIHGSGTSMQVLAIDTFWFAGGRAPIGGTMHVRMFSPPTAGPQSYLSLLAVGPAFLPVGVPVAPLQGLLGIDPIGGWTSPWFLHDNANGEANVAIPIPNTPGLSGLSLPAQSVTWEMGSGALYLGNTARLAVD